MKKWMVRIGKCVTLISLNKSRKMLLTRDITENVERKILKYETISKIAEIIPFGVNTLGSFEPGASELLKNIFKTLFKEAGEFLQQLLGIVIVWGNVASEFFFCNSNFNGINIIWN